MRRPLALLFVLLFVHSCASAPSGPTVTGKDFAFAPLPSFVAGRTTKAEVSQKLGQPLKRSTVADGKGELWTYERSENRSARGKSINNTKSAYISFMGDKMLTATWQTARVQVGAGGGGTKIKRADIDRLKREAKVNADMVRQRFGEPEQRIWNHDGTQIWQYISVGFAGTGRETNKFEFDKDGALKKVSIGE